MHKEILILAKNRVEAFFLNRYILINGGFVCNAYSIEDAKKLIDIRSVARVLSTMDLSPDTDLGVPVDYVRDRVDTRLLGAIISGTYAGMPLEKARYEDLLPFKYYEKIHDIDWASGIENCGSAPGYVEALELFLGTIGTKAGEIEGFVDNADLENYTISVHALKSSAKIIGADKLSEMAYRMEQAGNNGDGHAVAEDTPAMLEKYRSYLKVNI